jgi:acetyltransferase
MALVADHRDPERGVHQILGVGRLSKLHSTDEAEFGPVVCDDFHDRGLGPELLRRLVAIGRDERLRGISGLILPQHRAMLRICEGLGFRIHPRDEGRLMHAELPISD